MRRQISCIGGIIAAACAGESLTEANHPTPPTLNVRASGQCVVGGQSPASNWPRYWECGEAIGFHFNAGITQAQQTEIGAAAYAWNEALEPELTNLPQISGSEGFLITSTSPSSGDLTGWNGIVYFDQTNINFSKVSENQYELRAVALHEFGHLLGFPASDNVSGIKNVSDHCAFEKANRTAIVPCQHDIEHVRWIYGMRAAAPLLNQHIVTSVVMPLTGLSLSEGQYRADAGSQFTVSIDSLRFRRAHASFCPAGQCSIPVTNTNLEAVWVYSHSVLEEVSSTPTSITLRAYGAGTTTIRAKLTSTAFDFATGLSNSEVGTVTVTSSAVNPPTSFTRANCKTQAGSPETYSLYLKWQRNGATGWEFYRLPIGNETDTTLVSSGLYPSFATYIMRYTPYYEAGTYRHIVRNIGPTGLASAFAERWDDLTEGCSTIQ